MLSLPPLLGLLLLGPPEPGACQPRPLRPEARRLVVPYLEALGKLEDPSGKSAAGLVATLDRRFSAILADRSPAGDAALVFLLNAYVGEASGERVTCEALDRGARLVPLVRNFLACRPSLGDAALEARFRADGLKAARVLDRVGQAEKCARR